jgi:5'-AMP-activated protein kinase, regulatory gamma subunit
MYLLFISLHAFMMFFGVIQYRFFVDGVWRCDEAKPCACDEYGLISNEVLVENNAHPVVPQESSSNRGINMDDGTILTTVCPISLTLYFCFTYS